MMERHDHMNPWADKLQDITLPGEEGAWEAMEALLDQEMPVVKRGDRRRWVLLIILLLLLIGVCNCPGVRRWSAESVRPAGDRNDRRDDSVGDKRNETVRGKGNGVAGEKENGPAGVENDPVKENYVVKARENDPVKVRENGPVKVKGGDRPGGNGSDGRARGGGRGKAGGKKENPGDHDRSGIGAVRGRDNAMERKTVTERDTVMGRETTTARNPVTIRDTVVEGDSGTVRDTATAKKANRRADSTDTARKPVRKADSTATAKKTAKTPKADSVLQVKGWLAGVGLNQFFTVGQQAHSNFNSSGTTGGVSDYIPVPMIRYYFSRKLFVQLEAQFNAPQYTTKDLLANVSKPDSATQPGRILQTHTYIKKLFYFNLPLSVHYSPIPNLYLGAGMQYARLTNGVALYQDSFHRYFGSVDTLLSAKVQSFKNDPVYRQLKTNEFRLLLDLDYNFKRFIVGARYNWALSPFIDVQLLNSQVTQARNSSLQVYLRYIIRDGRKKKLLPK